MSNVIISDSTNAAYDGKLATASGFYRVEAHNLGFASTTMLTLPQTLAVTFANAGNCKGFLCCHYNQGNVNRGIQVDLREIKGTATLPVASPGIVTFNGHGFTGGEPVSFTTTGTLPTGVVADTVYYAQYIDANTFYLNAVAGDGTPKNFTGTSSGTHTLRAIRASSTKTSAQMIGSTPAASVAGSYITSFKFATPYAVDTTAGKWDFRLVAVGGTVGTVQVMTSDITHMSYAAWCDTQVTFTDNDTPIFFDPIAINTSATFGGILPTGVTDRGTCGVVCSNSDIDPDNVSLLTWELDPASSYTLTLKGSLIGGTHSGFRVGTDAKPIPIAQQADILFDTPTVGTATSGIWFTTNARHNHRSSFFVYGEIPALVKTTLANDALQTQKVIVTTDDMSSVWAANDYICIGKNDICAQGDLTYHQIDTIVGTTITLKANLTTKRLAGGSVFIFKRGVRFRSPDTNVRIFFNGYMPANFIMRGAECVMVYANIPLQSASYIAGFDSTECTQYVMEDCTFRGTGSTTGGGFLAVSVPNAGCSIKRNYAFRMCVLTNTYALYNAKMNSGLVEASDNIMVSLYYSSFGYAGNLNTKTKYENNKFENSVGQTYLCENGLFPIINNNYFYGIPSTSTFGTYWVGQSIGGTASGNIIDRCGQGIVFGPNLQKSCINKNMVFGPTVANTNDIGFGIGAYTDYELNSPSGALTFDYTNLPDNIDGTHLKITDYNDVANDDRGYLTFGYFQRTGPAPLTDNTVHTAGGYAMRFESTSGTDLLRWAQDIPTSNIQNKTMTVNVWCKINNAAYYGGTDYQMPRLTINYDNGTIAYVEAVAGTDWQLLSLSFTPTTTYGKITATLSTMTDATGSDAYVYFDDYGVLLPAGVQLNLGNLDLWANGLPVMPTIATNVSANDVWSVLISTLTGSGTIGNLITKLLTLAKFLALK